MDKNKIFRIKSVEAALKDAENSGVKMSRSLSKWDLMLLGIGAVIGAGIFVVTGTAAAGSPEVPGAGPAIIISFLITGIACGFAGLCYAELASMIPIAGSAYMYAYTALGEIFAWIIGWSLSLEYMIGAVTVSIGWSGYFNSFLNAILGENFRLPSWLINNFTNVNGAVLNPASHIKAFADKFPDLASSLSKIASDPSISDKASAMYGAISANPAYLNPETSSPALINFAGLIEAAKSAPHIGSIAIALNLPAIAVLLGITTLLVIGISQASKFNNIIVAIKFIILGTFVGVGIQHIDPSNWIPFMPNGIQSVQTGAAIIFFAYTGFDSISTAAEETKDPGKDIPFGIISSLAACTGIYMIVAGVMTGICPWEKLGTSEPISTALLYIGQNVIAEYIVSTGAVIFLLSVMMVMLLGQSRIFMSMSRDGFLPPWLAKIHPKLKTPYVSTIIAGVMTMIFAAIFSIDVMTELCNIGTLFVFIIVCVAILILRKKRPDANRPFKVPFMPVIPILGIIMCLYLMTGLPLSTWLRFTAWIAAGIAIYFCYGYRHTKDFCKETPIKENAETK